MIKAQNTKQYDLEERTAQFAARVRSFIKRIPKTTANFEDGKQVIRSSGSIGANYIEANEALSRKDFFMRIKICRKEAKETTFWLRLIDMNGDVNLENERDMLYNEAIEPMKIFGAILKKS